MYTITSPISARFENNAFKVSLKETCSALSVTGTRSVHMK